ncbi:hypothetical protein FHR84_002195 [Actinopolyspora biskrensis]|uniref:Uncharacterized protein n=1 Tax=Actinopolyspora biskrensis TaxID=1470178 RepID=A0A852YXX9_9ACTN|nr:hypothetical protein [Actinopolyspora biskrensis]NYH78870.1 hypothetical protein [Actinopolyspora biskrensis]
MSREHDRERAGADRSRGPTGGFLRGGLRGAAVPVVSAVLAAGGLAGAGVADASSSPVVIGTCTEDVSSDSFGQRIVASPTALDAKVKQAALLVFPLQFERADEIREQFLESAPVELGAVTERDQEFSGGDLAEALAPSIAAIPSVEDKGEAVNFHVGNLAAIGCLGGVSVPGQEEAGSSETPTSPSEPPPSSAPDPTGTGDSPGGEQPGNQRPSSRAPETGDSAPGGTTPNHPPGPAARVNPSDYAYVPGSLPPWSDTRFGEAPGGRAETGDLRSDEKHNQQDRVREAGSAEALPSDAGSRVALPVLLAAISLAGVTSALIRTWVLRRT